MPELLRASLVLENGFSFDGYSFGYDKPVNGEVVFNTGMVGYPQTLTDPSYKEQILCLTYPLIGNYGVPGKKTKNGLIEHFESEKIQIKALLVSDYSFEYNHYDSVKSLQQWLKEEKIPAITGINTRELTQVLREKGVMLGKIVINGKGKNQKLSDPNKKNLVEKVSSDKVQEFGSGSKTIAVVDCGAKNNIIRSLIQRNVKVLRIPWNYDLFEKNESFDALFFSNGPGDPTLVKKTIDLAKKSMESNYPTLGICLGNQILALAAGAKTYKLKYGHRSQNQPCVLKGTKTCYITSQNHGFAVDSKSLPKNWNEWFYNANDNSNEGIKHKTKPFMSVQFHPEAMPGPFDANSLFDLMLKEVKK